MNLGRVVANFLIVDDDRLFANSTARQYRTFGEARAVGSLAEANQALELESWTGIVLDVRLPDGSGLDFLADVRRERRATAFSPSVLVCSGLADERDLRARSVSLAATFLPKLSSPLRHWRFARRAIAADFVRDEAADQVAGVAQEHELSAMQTRVLALQVGAVPREEWTTILGVKPNTIKTHVGRVCARAGVASLADLAAPIIRSVMNARRH